MRGWGVIFIYFPFGFCVVFFIFATVLPVGPTLGYRQEQDFSMGIFVGVYVTL